MHVFSSCYYLQMIICPLTILYYYVNCSANLRKKPRPGPETWKLRGAARPAWEVYDFDTRYVDPHIKALEQHKERLKRNVNVFSLCRGRFAMDGMESNDNTNVSSENENDNNDDKNNNKNNNLFPPPQPHCRTYLSLLTQLGSLHLSRKNYSSARSSFLQAIELEGGHHPQSITNARTQLMNMYLSTNRPSSARKLWNLLPFDSSAWIRYSAALIEYASWNLLKEDGSTQRSAESALANAIRGNVYVVYVLGWKEMFDRAMEYTADVVEWGDGESGSVLEAVEYYGCGVMEKEDEDDERGLAVWLGTEGSLDWVRSFVLRVLNGNYVVDDEEGDLKNILSGWETKLAEEEEAYEKQVKERTTSNEEDDGDAEDEEPDVLMYSGMFRTAMDWLQDAGEFKKSPTDDYIIQNVVQNHIEEDEPNNNSSAILDDNVESSSGRSDSDESSDAESEDDDE